MGKYSKLGVVVAASEGWVEEDVESVVDGSCTS